MSKPTNAIATHADAPARYFLYVRKSTDDASRQLRSIEDQIAEAKELAAREGLEIVEVLEEKQTAKLPGRPIFGQMMRRIEAGEAQGILAWHPDRLSRNSLDGGHLIWLIDTGRIKDLKFCTQTFEPTPHGKLMLAIAFGMSKYYVDNLSENIRRGQRRKLAAGVWPQMCPLGYLNDHATRTIKPDPLRAPLVRRVFELYAAGQVTISALTQAGKELGLTSRAGTPLRRAQYHRMLRNPLYYGVFRYKGELYEGVHDPIITHELFERVQKVIGTCRKTRRKGMKLKPYLYRGCFVCGECGCMATTETQKGHNYVHCSKRKGPCSQCFVREEEVSRQVTDWLNRVSLPQDWADWMLAELEARRLEADREQQAQREALKEKATEHQQKLDRLLTAHLEGVISIEEYRAAKNKLIAEKRDSESFLTAFEQDRLVPFEPASKFIKASVEAGLLAHSGDEVAKRDFLRKTGSNFILRDRSLEITLRGAWKLVDRQRFLDANEEAAPVTGAAPPAETDLFSQKR